MRRLTAVLLVCSVLPGRAGGAEPVAPERTLAIVLDAVPYETMARLTSAEPGALFESFEPPVPLISTFPSSTSVALAGILGDLDLEMSPGYEARIFDWEERKVRGGGPISYFRVDFPWRSYFDWNRKGPFRNAMHGARPVKAGIRELRAAIAAFEASDKPTFAVYVSDTDTAVHLDGPSGGIDEMLSELSADLEALRNRVGYELRIVLLSDHGLAGGPPLSNVLPDVEERLEAGGWRLGKALRNRRDVVLTPYGLVSSFEVYSEPAEVAGLAGALAEIDGIELCVARGLDGWKVEGEGWTIDFERKVSESGLKWRWTVDGLADGGLPAVLASVGRGAGTDWVGDEELLAATLGADYPDPLYRLVGAFEGVRNPASVICSLATTHMFGARATERIARFTKGRLRWTHGSLHREASLGFVMTNRSLRANPAGLRFDRALAHVMPSTRVTMAAE